MTVLVCPECLATHWGVVVAPKNVQLFCMHCGFWYTVLVKCEEEEKAH